LRYKILISIPIYTITFLKIFDVKISAQLNFQEAKNSCLTGIIFKV